MNYITQNNFSIVRFKMLLKRELTSERQQLLLKSAVLLGMIVIVEFIITWACYRDWESNRLFYGEAVNDESGSFVAIAWVVGLGLFSTISASFVCANLSNKPGRINAFMTVGTPLEKYLSRALTYTVGFFVLYVFGSVVIDLLRCLYIMIATPARPHLFMHFLFKNVEFSAIYFFSSAFLLQQAFFTLVSAYFPRLAFIKGICCMIVVTMIMSFVVSQIVPYFYRNYRLDDDLLIYIYSTGMLVFTAVMHVLAYYRYKETDIQ